VTRGAPPPLSPRPPSALTVRSVADAARLATPGPSLGPGLGPAPAALDGLLVPEPGVAAGLGSGPKAAVRPGVRQTMAYQCSKCPKQFASQSNLRRHFVNLHGQDRGPFFCPFCGKVTKNKISLKSHIYAYHKLPNNQPWPGDAGGASTVQTAK
jgi:ribosomal protein L37AE/L43A